MTRILVTGATGTVGSELVKQLTSSIPSLPSSSDIKVRGTLPRPNVEEGMSSTNLIREAKKNGVRQIVKLSVFQFVGSIGRWHRHEEKIIEEFGIPYTFLRAGAFMQNFISFFGQTIKSQNAL